MSVHATPALSLAVDFALLTNRGGVQAWMRWAGWSSHVGCDECAGDGRGAPCWGRAGCHTYERNCGCSACAQQQVLAEARFAPIAAQALGGADVVSLRAELAALDAQIEPSDRRAG